MHGVERLDYVQNHRLDLLNLRNHCEDFIHQTSEASCCCSYHVFLVAWFTVHNQPEYLCTPFRLDRVTLDGERVGAGTGSVPGEVEQLRLVSFESGPASRSPCQRLVDDILNAAAVYLRCTTRYPGCVVDIQERHYASVCRYFVLHEVCN